MTDRMAPLADQIKRISEFSPYVRNLYLFGSCARLEACWDSDVDLCLVLDEEARKIPDFSRKIHQLKGTVSDDVLGSVETDLKVVVGDSWESSQMLFIQNCCKCDGCRREVMEWIHQIENAMKREEQGL